MGAGVSIIPSGRAARLPCRAGRRAAVPGLPGLHGLAGHLVGYGA